MLARGSVQCDAGLPVDVAALRLLASRLTGVQAPANLSISTPEGFAYYALHPLDYADLIGRQELDSCFAFVIGIRSIGTTLSAVVAAKLSLREVETVRTTVRPVGHPYDRHCEFDPQQKKQIRFALSRNATFAICDEGPGRSGSSFLSVAEALEREGVPAERILLLCSYEPDAAALCAPDALRRWLRYRVAAAGMTSRIPDDAGEGLSGGCWRSKFLAHGATWPAAWPQMERVKYLSRDSKQLLKFDGHGEYGERIRDRNVALAASGFGAPYAGQTIGFGRHVLLNGRMGRGSDVTPQLLARMAEYCVWRAEEFPSRDAATHELETMARVNFERQFGAEPDLHLELVRPTLTDSRMQPHEWFHNTDGRWLKLDAVMHGDDHFFPGPCDIAWDLAGVIVEWELDEETREFFLKSYMGITGDDVMRRIHGYEIAYAVFRMAWSRMGAASASDAHEQARLLQDYRRYRSVVASRTRIPSLSRA